jgi:hypothetical protein
MINSVFFSVGKRRRWIYIYVYDHQKGRIKIQSKAKWNGKGGKSEGKVRDQQMNFRRMRQTHPSIWSGEFNHFMYKWRIIPASNSVGNFVHSEK